MLLPDRLRWDLPRSSTAQAKMHGTHCTLPRLVKHAAKRSATSEPGYFLLLGVQYGLCMAELQDHKCLWANCELVHFVPVAATSEML